MLVGKALDTTTPVLTKKQPAAEALELMNNLQVTVMPVVDAETGKLAGQVERNQFSDQAIKTVSEVTLQEPIKIFKRQHLFKAIQLMLKYELSLLPVVNDEWIYQGIICKEHILESLTHMLNITEFGSIITVELQQNDFTLSEIVQIIETEGGKILGITVETPDAEKSAYEISIKMNLKDVSRVASSLRRHSYNILTEAESEPAQIDLETRADELIKFLDV